MTRALRRTFAALTLVLLSSAAAFAQQTDAQPAPPQVAEPAGAIPSTITVDVTGAPGVDGTFLDAQIRRALDRRIRPTLRPGASISYGPIVPWPIFALAAGDRAAVNVTVTIAGDATSAPVSATTLVVVENVRYAPPPPSLLFLSDDPEYLPTEGLVFRGSVTAARPVRLYYYHSDVGVPRDLDVVLTAASPARVHLIESGAGPDLDVMSVGHSVSRDYLRYAQYGQGLIADVVPGRPFVVRHALLLQSEVVAGTMDLSVQSGSGVAVSVIATPAGGRPETYLGGPRLAYDGHHRHGIFDLASFGTLTATYAAGGPPAAVQYGTRGASPRNVDPNDDGRDYGNYGVVHRIMLTMNNPGDAPQLAYLYEKPLGGPVRSTFVIDGTMREVGCVRLQQPYWLATYQLPPHTLGAPVALTMPDGGSFFPVEVGVTDAPPTPYTPPVGSPDGCSPNTPAFPDQGGGATRRQPGR